MVTGELVVADENEGEDGGGAGPAGVDQTSKVGQQARLHNLSARAVWRVCIV